ncbi:MAG: CPBP family intramembrane metalloprotease [Phycisphaerae bacterium]|nr:CPBP family intramembrane metalloprotease [Phycisphaerae bacterium]
MISKSRIRVIYTKELVDILRDRRTLIAMIVVPVLLYPLLMLGAAQAISVQTSLLRKDAIVLATPNAEQQAFLAKLIAEDRAALEYEADVSTNGEQDSAGQAEPLETPVLDASRDPAGRTLEELVRAREIHVGVRIIGYRSFEPFFGQMSFELAYDPEEARSRCAAVQVEEFLQRCERRLIDLRLHYYRVPVEAIEPIKVEHKTLATAGSVLSQILPLILVLMTITGAIYPAIDLTAGERERGTLETLMVCPVPVIELIVGKFLVIATIAIMGAVLNLSSISATVYFGGFQAMLSGSQDASFPFAVFPIILLALIPFAILFSAIMIAVCSYAHTFKEAQNYITPIILAALVPGGIAALPATTLSGPMLIMPVANMVLLTRELLLGATEGRIIGGNVTWSALAWVLASTVLYASAAVAVAAKIFGTESVIFADTGSIRSAFSRRMFRPALRPSVSMVALVVALLFPMWFYFQHGLQTATGDDIFALLRGTAIWMPVFFLILPLAVLMYWKVDVSATWCLRPGRLKFHLAAVLVGLTAWIPLNELLVLQDKLIPFQELLQGQDAKFVTALNSVSPWLALLLIAVIPGMCEELFFRGFFMSGLRGSTGKWKAIILSACVFGIFHFMFFRIPTTVALGIVLGYLCWQARSIWPAVLCHAVHNGFVVVRVQMPWINDWLSLDTESSLAHLPMQVIVPAVVLMLCGLALCRRSDL